MLLGAASGVVKLAWQEDDDEAGAEVRRATRRRRHRRYTRRMKCSSIFGDAFSEEEEPVALPARRAGAARVLRVQRADAVPGGGGACPSCGFRRGATRLSRACLASPHRAPAAALLSRGVAARRAVELAAARPAFELSSIVDDEMNGLIASPPPLPPPARTAALWRRRRAAEAAVGGAADRSRGAMADDAETGCAVGANCRRRRRRRRQRLQRRQWAGVAISPVVGGGGGPDERVAAVAARHGTAA